MIACPSCDRNAGRGAPGGAADDRHAARLDATSGAGLIRFTVFADSFQVYVYDSRTEPVFIREWNNRAISDKLVVKPGAIAFCPMRELDVPVTVRVQPSAPAADLSAWDHVAECTLDAPSGRVLVMGPVDTPAARIDLPPGTYRLRISSGGFASIDAAGLNGDDHYELCLWPADPAPLQVLKRHGGGAATPPPVEP